MWREPTRHGRREAISDIKVPASAAGVLLISPTTHIDWDWIDTFVEYVTIGPQPNGSWLGPTDQVLDGVAQLLSSEPEFRFSLAEVGYLRRFIGHQPSALATLQATGIERFLLMGDGITSPDNLVCNGEVFIRNYLLGRQWLREPLAEALAYSNPPRAALVAGNQDQVVLPTETSLAGVTGGTAILRAARTQEGSTTAASGSWPQREQVSFVLRVYLASAATGSLSPVTITLPFLGKGATFTAESVTALEEPLQGPQPTVTGNTLTFTPTGALSTVRITVTRPATMPTDGR